MPEMIDDPKLSIALEVWREWKFCECGNPEDVMALVRDALRAISDRGDALHALPGHLGWSDGDEAARQIEMKVLPLDSPQALLLRYLMASADLTEHGSSVFGAWLTDKGRDLLSFLDNVDQDEWMTEID